MTTELFAIEDGNTELTPEGKPALSPTLSPRAELYAFERANIHAARVWAMRPRNMTRSDLLTDAFSRDLHKRMFNQVWCWAGRYRITKRVRNAFDDAGDFAPLLTFARSQSSRTLPSNRGGEARFPLNACALANGTDCSPSKGC